MILGMRIIQTGFSNQKRGSNLHFFKTEFIRASNFKDAKKNFNKEKKVL
jgi:hypothetical protein